MIMQPVLVSGIQPDACFEQSEAFPRSSREEQCRSEISMGTGEVRAKGESTLGLGNRTLLITAKVEIPMEKRPRSSV